METKFYQQPKAESVTLVASLPDMGQVGGLVPQYLVEHLGAEVFAEIQHQDKPYVLCKDGLISFVPSVYRFYFSPRGDLVIMTGSDQPQHSQELFALCHSVLEVAERAGRIKRVYTAGGYSRKQLTGEPRVYGVANMRHLFTELDRLGIREVGPEISTITWFNGLILGVALAKKIEAVGLYGEIDDPAVPQPRAARSVVKSLVTLLSLPQIDAWKTAGQ